MNNPVTHFEIGAAEHQALVNFYGELFGWGLREVWEGYTLTDTGGGGGLNGGIGRSGTGEPWATFYVEVDDLQACLDRAEALGGRTVLRVTEMPGMAFAMFDDPDGLLVGPVGPRTRCSSGPRPGPGRRWTGSRCWGATPAGRRRSTPSCSAGTCPGGPTGRCAS